MINDLTASATAGASFKLPLDAALSPDGKTAYFIAVSPATGDPAVFKANAPSTAEPTQLHMGAPFAAPFGLDVNGDGLMLVVSDTGVEDDVTGDRGILYTLSTAAASAPAVVTGTAGYQPKGIVVVVEGAVNQVYFTGKDKADGQAGVFKVAISGGAVSVIAKGAPFVDPSGLAVAKNGTVYVADVAASQGGASILKIVQGVTTTVLPDLRVGYPAGIALSFDESTLLISALDPAAGTDAVIRYNIAANTNEYIVAGGIDQYTESAGLKRARNVDTYIWADSAANNGGTVYVINKQP